MMGVNLARVKVAMVVIAVRGHVIDQMISDQLQCDAALIVGRVGIAQILDRRSTVRDFIFAKNDRVSRAAGIGSLHLRFEAARTASRRAM